MEPPFSAETMSVSTTVYVNVSSEHHTCKQLQVRMKIIVPLLAKNGSKHAIFLWGEEGGHAPRH